MRALAWKEARQLAVPLGAALACAALATAFVRSPAVLAGMPLSVTLFGATAVAGERADGSFDYLLARAVSGASILRVKLVAHGLAASLAAIAFALAALSTPGVVTVDAGVLLSSLPGLLALASPFAVAFACSLLLPDGLTAAPSAMLATACWWGALLAPGRALGGSFDVAIHDAAALVPLAIVVPAGIARALATRAPWRAAPPSLRERATWALAIVIALGLSVLALREPRNVWDVRKGRATVTDPVVADAVGAELAFVATPLHGGSRAVIELLDTDPPGIVVLPPGTRPIALDRGELLVETTNGELETAGPDGTIRGGAATPAAPGRDKPSRFTVRDGRVIRLADGAVVYPPAAR